MSAVDLPCSGLAANDVRRLKHGKLRRQTYIIADPLNRNPALSLPQPEVQLVDPCSAQTGKVRFEKEKVPCNVPLHTYIIHVSDHLVKLQR